MRAPSLRHRVWYAWAWIYSDGGSAYEGYTGGIPVLYPSRRAAEGRYGNGREKNDDGVAIRVRIETVQVKKT